MSFKKNSRDQLEITDPRAMRALAHPVRLDLLAALAAGPLTATQCAERVGESPQSLFNCTGAGVSAPSNHLPSYDNCQVRVSTSNTTVTPDQFFIALEFTRVASTPPARAAAGPSWPWNISLRNVQIF